MCTINQDHMVYGSWDIKCKGQSFLLFWSIFWTLTLLTIQKIKTLKKIKKILKIISFYASASKMTIIWCTVLEILSMTEFFLILDHFLPFTLSPLPLTTQRIKYDIWFLRYEVQQTEFFCHLGQFFPLFPPRARKMKISKKWKNTWRYLTDVIIIFHFGL